MGRKCFVPYCKSGYSSCHDSVAMFSCPNDPVEIKRWSEAVSREDRPLRSADCICEKHFKEEDVISNWRAYDRNGKEVMKVPYKRKRLRDGAIPCFFPSHNNCYSRKRRNSDYECDTKIRKILSNDAESYPDSVIIRSDKEKNFSEMNVFSNKYNDINSHSELSIDEFATTGKNSNENFKELALSLDGSESEDEMKYIDILNKARLFDDMWSDSHIVTLPSRSWAIFLLDTNEGKKIVITQMGLSSSGAPTPVKQVCLNSEMKVELYLKGNKLDFEEMNVKPPNMFTVDDVSLFIQSVDGLNDWE